MYKVSSIIVLYIPGTFKATLALHLERIFRVNILEIVYIYRIIDISVSYLNRGWSGNMSWSGKQSDADDDVPGVDLYDGQVLSGHPFLK